MFMLTKTDIKIIKDLLKDFATKNDLKTFAIKDDLKAFATKDDLQKELKPIKRDINKIRRDLEMVTGTLDEEQVKLNRRVERIETHLHLPSFQ